MEQGAAILEVACHRCDRHGRLSLVRLIAEHGEGTALSDLREVLAGDCVGVKQAVVSMANLLPQTNTCACYTNRPRRNSGNSRSGSGPRIEMAYSQPILNDRRRSKAACAPDPRTTRGLTLRGGFNQPFP